MVRPQKGSLPLPIQAMATFFDLFCGAGGLTCGLRAAGLRHLGGCDLDRHACDSYEANHGAALRGDMRHLTAAMVMAATGGRVPDLLAGSPPCQSVSGVGRTAKATHANDCLYVEVVRLALELGSKAVLIENVAAFSTKRAECGTTLVGLAAAALQVWGRCTAPSANPNVDAQPPAGPQEAGFVVEHRVLDAADYAVPQHRRRTILLAARPPCSWRWPATDPGRPPRFRDFAMTDEDARLSTVGGYDLFMSPEKSSYYLKRKRANPNYTHFVDPDAVPRTLRAGYLKSRGAEALVAREAAGELTATPDQNCSSMRMMSLAEIKTIQSFPHDYKFCGPAGAVYQQVGNAVPPLLAAALGRGLLLGQGERGDD